MNTHRFYRVKTAFIFFCMIGTIMGCSSDPASPTLPGVEPEVANNQDTFEFQVTSVENYTGSWSYNWMTTGTVVNVDQSSAITSGTITLTIRDSNGHTVYSGDLSQGGSFTTNSGTTGQWQILITLVNGSGTLNFRVEKNQ